MDWMSKKPFLKVPRGPQTPGTELLEFAMGSWSLWVVEPLRMGPGVAATVDINLWQHCGEHFELSMFGNNNTTLIASDIHSYIVDLKKNDDPESALEAVKQGDEMTSVMKRISAPRDVNGEKIISIRDMLLRRKLYEVIDGTDPGIYPIGPIMFQNRSGYDLDITTRLNDGSWFGRSLFTYYGSAYRGWRGPMRFRVQYVPNAIKTLIALGRPEPFSDGFSDGFMLGFTTDAFDRSLGTERRNTRPIELDQLVTAERYQDATNDNGARTNIYSQCGGPFLWSDPGANVLDVEVPFYASEKFKLVCTGSVNDFSQWADECMSGCVVAVPGAPYNWKVNDGGTVDIDPAVGRMRTWMACGDDFRLGLFLGPPAMTLLQQNIGQDTYTY